MESGVRLKLRLLIVAVFLLAGAVVFISIRDRSMRRPVDVGDPCALLDD